MTGTQIVSKAREYDGTPWKHTGRLKLIGIDCVGLVICVFNELGDNLPLNTDYTLEDEFYKLAKRLRHHLDEIPSPEKRAGDILLFRGPDLHNHVAIFSGEGTIIHAYGATAYKRVVEQPYSPWWDTKVVKVFRHRLCDN